MRYRKLPLRLRLKVEDYYEHRFHHKLFDEDMILSELSKALREVRRFTVTINYFFAFRRRKISIVFVIARG